MVKTPLIVDSGAGYLNPAAILRNGRLLDFITIPVSRTANCQSIKLDSIARTHKLWQYAKP